MVTLRLPDGTVQAQGRNRKEAEHRKGEQVAAGIAQQAIGCHSNQGGSHQIKIHEGKIGRKVFWTVKGRNKCGGYCRARAIGYPNQAQAKHAQGHRMQDNGQQRH